MRILAKAFAIIAWLSALVVYVTGGIIDAMLAGVLVVVGVGLWFGADFIVMLERAEKRQKP